MVPKMKLVETMYKLFTPPTEVQKEINLKIQFSAKNTEREIVERKRKAEEDVPIVTCISA